MTTTTVMGCGCPGAVHAACMAQLGHDAGVDLDAAVPALLGHLPPGYVAPDPTGAHLCRPGSSRSVDG
jgi:hypothetical protein